MFHMNAGFIVKSIGINFKSRVNVDLEWFNISLNPDQWKLLFNI